MKHLLSLLLFLFIMNQTKAQLKIDSNYTFLINDTSYANGSFPRFVFDSDSIGIKEIATGKTCAIVSAEWIFIIQGNVFNDTKAADIKAHLAICKPKDKLFIEKIRLASGCFIPPRQIMFNVI